MVNTNIKKNKTVRSISLNNRSQLSFLLKKHLTEINQVLNFPIQYARREKGKDVYKFVGIQSHIVLLVSEQTAQIEFRFQSNFRDIIVDFDLFLSIDENGKYYCSGCKNPTHYYSKSELIQRHFMDTLSKFQKKHFRKDRYIVLCASNDKDIVLSKVIKKSDMKHFDQLELIWISNKSSKSLNEENIRFFSKMYLKLYAVERIIL